MTKVIGRKLYISPYTVSRHLRNICHKCHARNSIHLIAKFADTTSSSKAHPILSQRENQIMGLLMNGINTNEIAQMFGVSVATIRKHRENILRKLDVSSIRQATMLVINLPLSD